MPTSVSNTAYGIINDAYHAVGKLSEGDIPNSQQLADNMRLLNDIINLWQTQGLKLFLQEEIVVPLVVGQTQYVLGPSGPAVIIPRPPRILQGYVTQIQGNNRRPLVLLSRDEWIRLSQVTGNNGTINSFMVDKQATQTNLNLWPPPDATEVLNTATFLMQVQASNPLFLTDSMGFPQEWRLALMWGLADEISTGQPQAIMDRAETRAKKYRDALEDWDVEDAQTLFNVDTRFYHGQGKFR